MARAIERYPYYTVFDFVGGTIDDGVVTLDGYVTATPDKNDDIVRRLMQVRGVQAIHDGIQVLSPSRGDHALRLMIARRVFRNANFQRFSSMPTPPFHIIVHNSVVTLVGVVQSEIDRRELERIARQTPGVLRVNSRLRTRTGNSRAGG